MAPVLFALFLLVNCGAYNGATGDGTFHGNKVIRVVPANSDQVNVLRGLVDNDDLQLDFWQLPSHVGNSVDIHVTAADYPALAKILQVNSMVFSLLISDVQNAVEEERRQVEIGGRSGRVGYDYGQYHRIDEIIGELRSLASRYSRIAKLLTLGKSYQGREMYAMKISSGQGKKSFFFNCGIHAREWVTQATCMYMINQMLTNYGQDSTVTAMIDKMDWVIVPAFNVDGYAYTWTGNRMWRKTRKPNTGSSCVGTDPNRNWNYGWAGVGASGSACRDTYYGSRPFSEVETRNAAHYLYKNRRNLAGYMDIHAYSQLWMTPWGYTKTYPKDYTEMKRVADIAVKALQNAGYRTSYRAGPSSIIIYENSGGTKDWTYGVLGLRYSYALELRDKGRYGFMLPANQIIPTGTETFAAIKAMAQAMQI